jgi:hypothetical protein
MKILLIITIILAFILACLILFIPIGISIFYIIHNNCSLEQVFGSLEQIFSGYSKVSTALVATIAAILAYLYWQQDKLLKLIEEYNDLSDSRVLFWNTTGRHYKAFYCYLNSGGCSVIKDRIIESFNKVDNPIGDDELEKLLDELLKKCRQLIRMEKEIKLRCLIERTGFPTPNYYLNITEFRPGESVYNWVNENIKRLCDYQVTLLLFALFSLSDEKIDKMKRKLAFFWYKWANIYSQPFRPFIFETLRDKFKILRDEYKGSNLNELLLLTWMELALAYKMGKPGKGKVEFLELSKDFWEKRLKIS